MKHAIKGVYIDQRDIELFTYLFRAKVATYQQIHRDIYPDITANRAEQRVRLLENNRFLAVSRSRLILNGKRTVMLSKRGFEAFVKNGSEKRAEIKSDAILHDLDLGDIRQKFETSPKVTRYQTENEIQTWGNDERKLGCDALATIALATREIQVPLEYEKTQKVASRYERMVKKYYQSPDYPILFLLAESQSIIEIIQRVERRNYSWDKPKIFYALKHDFLQNRALKLQNFNGTVFDLLQ